MRVQSIVFVFALFVTGMAQAADIPAVYSGIHSDSDGQMFFVTTAGDTLPLQVEEPSYTLRQMRRMPTGTDSGLVFDFDAPELAGRLYYGFIPGSDTVRIAYPVFFNRSATIDSGRAIVNILGYMKGKYDIAGWQHSGVSRFGYRVVEADGTILYDGKIMVAGTGPFRVDTSIVEGPFVNLMEPTGAVVSFETNVPVIAQVETAAGVFDDPTPTTHHEIHLTGLAPDTLNEYTVRYGRHHDTHVLRTPPPPGSRRPFMFAYASDGRGNNGAGERDLRGVNAYMLKKICALSAYHGARFLQFTGDLVDGYTNSPGRISLELANWKRAAEPFASLLPCIAGFGNHEGLLHIFYSEKGRVRLDRFPFATESAEVVFARSFVNPKNGPKSEDGAAYDPDPDQTDFPPYAETVFYYTWDNVAMVVLNSNYWFAPSLESHPESGGNLHGYVMDNQLQWLEETLASLEDDAAIDHVFVTIHTPIFPNGGHVGDDMWYDGDNSVRAVVRGVPVAHGIIERRDALLDLMMNRSSKVRAALTGDEHNYSRLRIADGMPMYPEGYTGPKLEKIRPIWQINNGAGGAPYYGREETPWAKNLQTFSTQNAVVFFYVDGDTVRVRVVNPDTMEQLDEFEL